MQQSNNTYLGWVQALFSVLFLWGISNIFISYSTQILEINKIIFTCVTFSSCSLLLLAYSGRGPLSRETLRSVDTWAYGIIMLINYFVTINLFSLVSASEASLLQRFSVVFSLFTSWIFLMRAPSKGQLVGVFMILFGILMVITTVPDSKAIQAYGLMFLAGLFQSLRIFIAEFHRPHVQAVKQNDIKTKCRVIGYIMFIITMIFASGAVICALLQETVAEQYRIGFLVEIKDFYHYPSILAGMIMGVFIYAPIRYLEFASTSKIKTENYLTVTALSFFSTLFWEYITSDFTGLSLKDFTSDDLLAGCIITAGALLMAFSKIKHTKKDESFAAYLTVETQNLEKVEDTRDILINTQEHFSGDLDKTAHALHLPKDIVKAILNDKTHSIMLKEDELPKVARFYRKNVAQADSLTGLLNRGSFMKELKAASLEVKKFSLLYIDLNDFKPVNDRFGHHAGDYILQEVAERLKIQYPYMSYITRLGGDEFCLLLLNVSKKDAIKEIDKVSSIIQTPFEYDSKEIKIGAAIGLACYPEDSSNPTELLNIADKNMYIDKKDR